MSAETLEFLESIQVNHWDGPYAVELLRKFFPLEFGLGDLA